MGQSIHFIYKATLLCFLCLLFPLFLYPVWEEKPSFGTTIFDGKQVPSKKEHALFNKESAGGSAAGDAFEKDQEDEAYAPPPGINEGDTPQKILPLDGGREIAAMLSLAAGFLLLDINRRKKRVRERK